MIPNSTMAKIAAATVHLTRRGGLGVLVPGHMIVTAAHVVHWTSENDGVWGPSLRRGHDSGSATAQNLCLGR
jgi:hypothetical protein